MIEKIAEHLGINYDLAVGISLGLFAGLIAAAAFVYIIRYWRLFLILGLSLSATLTPSLIYNFSSWDLYPVKYIPLFFTASIVFHAVLVWRCIRWNPEKDKRDKAIEIVTMRIHINRLRTEARKLTRKVKRNKQTADKRIKALENARTEPLNERFSTGVGYTTSDPAIF